MKREDVFRLVATAIHDLNEELEYPSLNHVTEDTPLFGGEHSIDSLSLVRLLVDLEARVAETTGIPISLADEKAMSWRKSPYRTAGALVDFIIIKAGQRATAGQASTNDESISMALPNGD